MWPFSRKQPKPDAPAPDSTARGGIFSSDIPNSPNQRRVLTAKLVDAWNSYLNRNIPKPVSSDGVAMDDSDGSPSSIKQAYAIAQPAMSDALFLFFATQQFIGHQTCGILAQHWLIDNICTQPAKDALRHGWEIKAGPGAEDIDDAVQDRLSELNTQYKIGEMLLEFIRMGRIFGIRIAIPIIESGDVEYYEKPYNPDGVAKGSFKGWVQIDPYWTSPILSGDAAGKPDAQDFYEPTWWLVNGRRYHRSHLCIFRTGQPIDILKPAYIYSGVPIPQKIMERVYSAERTANEAPLLAMTKRTTTLKINDVAQAFANKEQFDQRLADWVGYRDNYGVKVIGDGEEMTQMDTSLTDLTDVIDKNYAIACAAGGVPVNKIMGTAAGGLSNEGAYDESNYHESLESMQTHELNPFLLRHYELMMLSEYEEAFNININWLPLDSPTRKEVAEVNLLKAQTDAQLIQTGGIDSTDVNERLRNDKTSGYTQLAPLQPQEPETDPDESDDDEID